ncbi:hypothetical protein CJF30_00003908 [Rutstroemia sp. NJR-2017a BBW]|nr:hypothetical protein CJF30_00003908 [Rutstroemia sp. NJR-2017a BBW]
MPQSRAAQVAAVTWVMVFLSTIATLLRIYCRGFLIKAFGPDDWLAVIAQGLFIIFCSYEITGVKYGTGQHLVNIAPENIPRAMQMWWTCEPLYVLANLFIKASIGIFLLRLCINKIHKLIIWTVLIVTEIYGLYFFLLFVLQCQPTSYFWNRYYLDNRPGKCLGGNLVTNSFIGYSAISCWTDWTFSILPMFLVWNLQMNSRTKLSVVLVLAAGVIASSATIVRFPYLHTLNDVNDFLYSTSDVAIWSTVETGIGITASAVATLRPLLNTFFGGSSVGQSGSNRQYKQSGTKGGYIKSSGNGTTDAFQLNENTNVGKTGITTVIEHGESQTDLERANHSRQDNRSSISVGSNSSQSELAKQDQGSSFGDSGWNVTIKKTVVQSHA